MYEKSIVTIKEFFMYNLPNIYRSNFFSQNYSYTVPFDGHRLTEQKRISPFDDHNFIRIETENVL